MDDQSVLVIGGGISGVTTAVELAEAGKDVYIVEKNMYLGGRVAQLNKYFPKLCPPVCGLEMNFRRIKENAQVEFYTGAEVTALAGESGNFDVTVTKAPRFVNEKCTGCGECARVCPGTRSNDFDLGLSTTKSAYLPFNQAFPFLYVIDRASCKSGCGEPCKAACKYDAIELDMKPETLSLKVSGVVNATGWKPYDMGNLDLLGGGTVRNVVSNMMMERLASPSGPTGGKVTRPSDGKEVKNVAFVQCAGSRDENHLAFCSYICCMASLKQATYVREAYEDSKVEIFYIDMRTPGRYEKFYNKVKSDPGVTLTKGKVASIAQDAGDNVSITVEDIFSGEKVTRSFDMVVLATGMQPSGAASKVAGMPYTAEGFGDAGAMKPGMTVVGTAKAPLDVQRSVQSATAGALKSLQSLVRR